MAYRVTFRQELCKSCEICVVSCPKKILFIDKNCLNDYGAHPATIKDMTQCIGCANCALMCPDAVICIEKLEDN